MFSLTQHWYNINLSEENSKDNLCLSRNESLFPGVRIHGNTESRAYHKREYAAVKTKRIPRFPAFSRPLRRRNVGSPNVFANADYERERERQLFLFLNKRKYLSPSSSTTNKIIILAIFISLCRDLWEQEENVSRLFRIKSEETCTSV